MVSTPNREQLGALLRDLREAAIVRASTLESDAAELRRDRSVDTADDEHDPEGVTLSSEWQRLAGLQADAVRELADIDEALTRWDAGTYGICIDCGRSIPIARLRARPAATRCVECAERAGR